MQRYKLLSLILVVVALASAADVRAQSADEFLAYARSYASDKGFQLSSETEAIIFEGAESAQKKLSADPSLAHDVRAAIRKLLDELAIDSINSETKKPDQITLILALQSVCPLWPICS